MSTSKLQLFSLIVVLTLGLGGCTPSPRPQSLPADLAPATETSVQTTPAETTSRTKQETDSPTQAKATLNQSDFENTLKELDSTAEAGEKMSQDNGELSDDSIGL